MIKESSNKYSCPGPQDKPQGVPGQVLTHTPHCQPDPAQDAASPGVLGT